MNIEEKYINNEKLCVNITFQLSTPMIYDRLNALSDEYSVPVEMLLNIAVKHLIDNVDFIRGLRTGKIELE